MTSKERAKRIIQAINETEQQLEKATKSLKDSLEFQEQYQDWQMWVDLDQARVDSLEAHIDKLSKMLAECVAQIERTQNEE